MKYIKIIIHLLGIFLLTVTTQIGGVIYVLALIINFYSIKNSHWKLNRRVSFLIIFLTLYLSASVFLVPVLAKYSGRVPLPLVGNERLKPLNVMTFILNRHYVKPELKKSLEKASIQMHSKYPNTVVRYLDANFPFFDGFSLLPHLSHNDGRKIFIEPHLKNRLKLKSTKVRFHGCRAVRHDDHLHLQMN